MNNGSHAGFKSWMVWHRIADLVADLLGETDVQTHQKLMVETVKRAGVPFHEVMQAIHAVDRECNKLWH